MHLEGDSCPRVVLQLVLAVSSFQCVRQNDTMRLDVPEQEDKINKE
jgi:hypothetical protein